MPATKPEARTNKPEQHDLYEIIDLEDYLKWLKAIDQPEPMPPDLQKLLTETVLKEVKKIKQQNEISNRKNSK